MDERSVLDLIEAGGVPYSQVREQIVPGDICLLHHAFVADWYGVQLAAVQAFTGPFAHVALLDRLAGRVLVMESVVPKVRAVPVSATASDVGGFFWLAMNRPITDAEREAAWAEVGVNEYSKVGAIEAGADALPATEDADPRRWCAKSVNLWRRKSGVDLGPRYVPTDMALEAMNRFNAQLQYVRMD